MKKWQLVSCLLFFSSTLVAQVTADIPIPFDPAVRKGILENGMTYYIRKNQKPEHRAELRLVVNAGSVLETDSQQGLAHFCEHMCFNGTKSFHKNELIDFLEQTGVRFGPDLNAYTNFDETVYMLQIPTDTEAVFRKAFQVLEDWAHNALLEDEEIDKERGVVVEEWRRGQGAEERMMRKWYPVYMKDSRYAERIPIGKKEIIENAPYDTLRKFYADWYKPELQAVIAIGDFDVEKVESLIKKQFGKIPPSAEKKERPLYPVADQKDLLISIATDPEATTTEINIEHKLPLVEVKTLTDFRNQLIARLFTGMLNSRYQELQQQPDPPFSFASSYYGPITRTKSTYRNSAYVNETGVERGIQTLMEENERVKRFGFTQTELDRQVKQLLRNIEKQYNERDKNESRQYTSAYVNNYLRNQPAPGIEWTYTMYNALLPTIRISEVNNLCSQWINDGENMVVVITAPEKQGIEIPTEDRIKEIMRHSREQELTMYNDQVVTKPLLSAKPKPGTTVSEQKVNEYNITELTFSNGTRVILKPTDFKNDEILFRAYNYGGTSLYSDSDYMSAQYSNVIMDNSGVGDFDQIQLKKYLSDKIVNVYSGISELQEIMGGSCSVKDLETMMQLLYLKFTAPRKDDTAFKAMMARQLALIQNQHNDPTSALFDTVQVTMAQHHFRYRPEDEGTLKEISLDRAYDIYNDRFGDAQGFTFVFVGSFTLDVIKPLIEIYIGGLPSSATTETYKDLGIRPPDGVVSKTVSKGTAPQSYVINIWTGPFEYNRNNRIEAYALQKLLNIKLRETLREDMSGVYGVSIAPDLTHYPKGEYSWYLQFGCSPDNVDKLIAAAIHVIDTVKISGCNAKDLIKVKELLLKEREVNLKQNNFWLSTLIANYENNEDIMELGMFEKQINSLTSDDFKRLATTYFNMDNYARFVLFPAAISEGEK